MNIDYVTSIITALCAVIGAGLLRVGLMHKRESTEDARKAWLFIVLGIAFGISAVLILVLKAMKIEG